MLVKRKLKTTKFIYIRVKSVLGKSVCNNCKYIVEIGSRKCCSKFVYPAKNRLCGTRMTAKGNYDIRKLKYAYRLY